MGARPNYFPIRERVKALPASQIWGLEKRGNLPISNFVSNHTQNIYINESSQLIVQSFASQEKDDSDPEVTSDCE